MGRWDPLWRDGGGIMKNQVLSIEQMQELKELGIDTSGASLYWYGTDETEFICFGTDMDKDYGDEICPAFTLQNVLEMLPQYIEESEIGRFDYELRIKKDEIVYESFDVFDSDMTPYSLSGFSIFDDEHEKTIIDCAFLMLKWCKEKNYI